MNLSFDTVYICRGKLKNPFLSDADRIRSAKEVTPVVGPPIVRSDGENTVFSRGGSSQYCGAGEGEAQHARVGEEIEQSLHIPGIIPSSFDHLLQC